MHAPTQAIQAPQAAEQAILNIAAYKFVPLDRLEQRRVELKELCQRFDVLGTILLSHEGINLFLAGHIDDVRGFLTTLRQQAPFADLEVKESYSDRCPFRRSLVRLKKEIIAFGVDNIRPHERTSPKLPAAALKQWLDQGKPLRLLDVRNDYEVDLGTFAGAEHLSIGNFREFPQAISQLPEEAKQTPIVMFCTGGIRCEKAGPLMEQAGFEEVYQLEGGILKYFEECGGAHYEGDCFVFDGRVALDPQLQPAGKLLCFNCQAVLTPDDVTSDQFLFGQYCPHCYVPPQEARRRAFAARQQAIASYAAQQPGCQPYDNLRRIHVSRRLANQRLLDFLQQYQPSIPVAQWQAWLAAGLITQHQRVVGEDYVVSEGECFEQHMPDTVEPMINPAIELIHEDDSLVVVNKPAPLPTHPSGRFNKNTLLHLMSQAYPHEKLRVAHRIDANTTGVVVLCRKHQASRQVQPQFSQRQVDKQYVARVHGQPEWLEMTCELPLGTEPGPLGARQQTPLGQPASTRLRVLKKLACGQSLIAAEPLSGRTHQIRLHLSSLGHPIVGDPLYLPNGEIGQQATCDVDAQPMCLHAASLTLTHPESQQRVTFTAQLPAWACDAD